MTYSETYHLSHRPHSSHHPSGDPPQACQSPPALHHLSAPAPSYSRGNQRYQEELGFPYSSLGAASQGGASHLDGGMLGGLLVPIGTMETSRDASGDGRSTPQARQHQQESLAPTSYISPFDSLYSMAPTSGSTGSTLSYAPAPSYPTRVHTYPSQLVASLPLDNLPERIPGASYESYPPYSPERESNGYPPPHNGHPAPYSHTREFSDPAEYEQSNGLEEPDAATQLADFFGLNSTVTMSPGKMVEDNVYQDSFMAYEDAISYHSTLSSGLAVPVEDVLYFGNGPRGVKYQYVIDPNLPPPGSEANARPYSATSSSSRGSSAYASPYAPTHSLPPSNFSSPQLLPDRLNVALPLTTYPAYSNTPLGSPAFPPAGTYLPSLSIPGPTPHPPSPYHHSSVGPSLYSPQPAPRQSSRPQPRSRAASFSHLSTFTPYPAPIQRPPPLHRHSTSALSSMHPRPTSSPAFSHPSPPAVQVSPVLAAAQKPLPTSLFDPSPTHGRIRHFLSSLSVPSPPSALHHRRSQSYAVRGVGANGHHPQPAALNTHEPLEGLSGLGFKFRRASSSESLWSEESAPSSGRRNSATQSRPLTPATGLVNEPAWNGTGEVVAGVREGMEGMTLRQETVGEEEMCIEMERGEGTVVLASGNEVLEEATKAYLDEPNRLLMGERSVLILAPKIAQRSYGNEKRFLCPQPMALLLGASWWTNVEDPAVKPAHYPTTKNRRVNLPPEITIAISTDPNPPTEPLLVDWMTKNGELVNHEFPIDNDTIVLSGRSTGKSSYVPSGDSGKDKRYPVRPLVTIVAPGDGPKESRLIGTFPGRPMHIISKPSKGKLTESSKTGLVHGDLVSLYNRIKSQTASTRFLGVSGNHSSFPTMDWRAMTGGQVRPFAPADVHSTTFVARTGRWDAFVIYAVDITLPTLDPGIVPAQAPISGYPRPPVNAIPYNPLVEKKIYYNMPIVLQCLSTAVVSPVMIIRKVDGNRCAIGGGSLSGSSGLSSAHGLPCAPHEQLGEAVAQFRPMALEIYTDPAKARSGDPKAQAPSENTFLACLGDTIGLNQSREARKYPHPDGSERSTSPVTPSPVSPAFPMTPNMPSSTSSFCIESGLPTPSTGGYDDDFSCHGSRVKKVRRTSSNGSISTMPYNTVAPVRPSSSLTKHSKRGQSLNNLSRLTDFEDVREPAPALQSVWSIDCGDACVWTIVAIDLARHTFHVPNDVTGGKPANAPTECPSFFSTPIPCYPISSLIPTVEEYELPRRRAGPHDVGDEEDTMITLHGENFSSAFTVWLGSNPCPRQTHKSAWRLLVSPPRRTRDGPPSTEAPLDAGLRISFVRNDGVVFPSSVLYRGPI